MPLGIYSHSQGPGFKSLPLLLCTKCQLSMPSLYGQLMSTSKNSGVNGHTTQCNGPISMVSWLWLVSSWDQRHPMGPIKLGRDFTFLLPLYITGALYIFNLYMCICVGKAIIQCIQQKYLWNICIASHVQHVMCRRHNVIRFIWTRLLQFSTRRLV